ncbi:hypothetical protein PM082_019288 [Marasmius tenuissimus]|nr:hypothetical protein PM082_019288 [Marasmius tenuissimus]
MGTPRTRTLQGQFSLTANLTVRSHTPLASDWRSSDERTFLSVHTTPSTSYVVVVAHLTKHEFVERNGLWGLFKSDCSSPASRGVAIFRLEERSRASEVTFRLRTFFYT